MEKNLNSCVFCGETVPPGSWKFCSRKHMNADYYRRNKNDPNSAWAKQRRKNLAAWKKSGAKGAGIGYWEWLFSPKEFKD